MTFRRDIEGLRAIAVLAVVGGHAGVPFVSGGYVGVDVFFVISGFLITSLLLNERRATGSISITGFYARRATRLLPAATVVILATLAAAWAWLPATRFPSIALDAVAGAFYGLNLRLAYTGTEYLNADAAPSPLQHFWSLAVEEQFYLVWPLLLIAATMAWRRHRFTVTLPVAVLLTVIAGSFVLSVVHTASGGPWPYFGTHTRAWELAAGALIAVFAGHLARLHRHAAAVITWSGLAAIVAAVFWFTEDTPFPGHAALLPVVGSVAVIAGGCAQPGGGAGLLLNRGPFQFIGKISYGFYLWHWPVLLIAPAALGVPASLPLHLLLCLVALVISVACFHLVENPIRTRRALKRLPWRGIGVGAALSATTAGFAGVAFWFPPSISGSGTAPDTAQAVAESDNPEETLHGLITDSMTMTSIPANLTPELAGIGSDRPVIYREDCHAAPEDESPRTDCVYGDPTGDKTVVLIGDSHAAQWFPALNEISRQQGWRLLPRTKSACSAPTVLTHSEIFGRDYHECVAWRDDTLDEIAEREPDMVIMSSSDADGNRPLGTSDPLRTWVDGWVEAYLRVASPDTALVNILDTPWAKTNVPDCLAGNPDRIEECHRPVADAIKQPERRHAAREALQPIVDTVIDPTSWLCDETDCPVIVGNLLVYRDGHHMTTDYSRMLAGPLYDRLPAI